MHTSGWVSLAAGSDLLVPSRSQHTDPLLSPLPILVSQQTQLCCLAALTRGLQQLCMELGPMQPCMGLSSCRPQAGRHCSPWCQAGGHTQTHTQRRRVHVSPPASEVAQGTDSPKGSAGGRWDGNSPVSALRGDVEGGLGVFSSVLRPPCHCSLILMEVSINLVT